MYEHHDSDLRMTVWKQMTTNHVRTTKLPLHIHELIYHESFGKSTTRQGDKITAPLKEQRNKKFFGG